MNVDTQISHDHDTFQCRDGEKSAQKNVGGGIQLPCSERPSIDGLSQAVVSVETASTPEADWQAAFDFVKTADARGKAVMEHWLLAFANAMRPSTDYIPRYPGDYYENGVHVSCYRVLQ